MPLSQRETNELVAQNQALLARIAALEAAKPPMGTLACKVSEKGALSVYGLQRFPITLYAEQWERLIENLPQIKAFLAANTGRLSRKPRQASSTSNAGPTPETAAALTIADRVLGSQE